MTRQRTIEIIDGLLMIATSGAAITTTLVLPGSVLLVGPIIDALLGDYDDREKEREYQRIIKYMQQKNLLALEPRKGNGLVITDAGKDRHKKTLIKNLEIKEQVSWDEKYRIVFFDVPELSRVRRNLFVKHLKSLGFYQLQRSVWVHRFPCKVVVETLAVHYKVDQYITFVDNAEIENSQELKDAMKA